MFDDSLEDADKRRWKELYDPDIDHLFQDQCLPGELWTPQDFKSRDLMEKLGMFEDGLSEEDKDEKFSSLQFDTFDFFVWSKEKWSEQLSDADLMAKFKKRFEKNLPLKYINCVFVQSWNE